MRTDDSVFSAKVELPCRIFCGPDAMLEFFGTAVNIDTGSLSLELNAASAGAGTPAGFGPGLGHAKGTGARLEMWIPAVGERVRLELNLPVSNQSAGARYLSFRAKIAGVTELPDGSKRLELTFRKPSFRDRVEGLNGSAKVAGGGWRM